MSTTGSITMVDMRASYVMLVRDLLHYGEKVIVRGDETRELLDVQLKFICPDRPMLPVGIGRNINSKLAAVEALALLAGSSEYDLTMAAAPSYASVLVSQDLDDFAYAAYGPRIGQTFDTVVHQLAHDSTSRQAVLSIWRREDLFHPGDKPCTLTIQFMIRANRLHMIVNMRSNDVWRGLGYDAFVFNQLHWAMLRELRKTYLDLDIGEYHHHAASLHLYERDIERTNSLSVSVRANATELPRGLVCPRNMFPDQVARILLESPSPVQSREMVQVREYNPWYAEQMVAIDKSMEAAK